MAENQEHQDEIGELPIFPAGTKYEMARTQARSAAQMYIA